MIIDNFGQQIIAIGEGGARGSFSLRCCAALPCLDSDHGRCVAMPFIQLDGMRMEALFHGFKASFT